MSVLDEIARLKAGLSNSGEQPPSAAKDASDPFAQPADPFAAKNKSSVGPFAQADSGESDGRRKASRKKKTASKKRNRSQSMDDIESENKDPNISANLSEKASIGDSSPLQPISKKVAPTVTDTEASEPTPKRQKMSDSEPQASATSENNSRSPKKPDNNSKSPEKSDNKSKNPEKSRSIVIKTKKSATMKAFFKTTTREDAMKQSIATTERVLATTTSTTTTKKKEEKTSKKKKKAKTPGLFADEESDEEGEVGEMDDFLVDDIGGAATREEEDRDESAMAFIDGEANESEADDGGNEADYDDDDDDLPEELREFRLVEKAQKERRAEMARQLAERKEKIKRIREHQDKTRRFVQKAREEREKAKKSRGPKSRRSGGGGAAESTASSSSADYGSRKPKKVNALLLKLQKRFADKLGGKFAKSFEAIQKRESTPAPTETSKTDSVDPEVSKTPAPDTDVTMEDVETATKADSLPGDSTGSQLPQATSSNDGVSPKASPTPTDDADASTADDVTADSNQDVSSISPSKSLSLASLSLSKADVTGDQGEAKKFTPSLSMDMWDEDEDISEDNDFHIVKGKDDDIKVMKQETGTKSAADTKSSANVSKKHLEEELRKQRPGHNSKFRRKHQRLALRRRAGRARQRSNSLPAPSTDQKTDDSQKDANETAKEKKPSATAVHANPFSAQAIREQQEKIALVGEEEESDREWGVDMAGKEKNDAGSVSDDDLWDMDDRALENALAQVEEDERTGFLDDLEQDLDKKQGVFADESQSKRAASEALESEFSQYTEKRKSTRIERRGGKERLRKYMAEQGVKPRKSGGSSLRQRMQQRGGGGGSTSDLLLGGAMGDDPDEFDDEYAPGASDGESVNSYDLSDFETENQRPAPAPTQSADVVGDAEAKDAAPPSKKRRLRKIESGSEDDTPSADVGASGNVGAESVAKENGMSDVEMEDVAKLSEKKDDEDEDEEREALDSLRKMMKRAVDAHKPASSPSAAADVGASQEDDHAPVNPYMFMDVAAELDEDEGDAAHAPDEQMTKEEKEFARGLIASKDYREAPNDQRKRDRLFRLLREETEKHDLEDFKKRFLEGDTSMMRNHEALQAEQRLRLARRLSQDKPTDWKELLHKTMETADKHDDSDEDEEERKARESMRRRLAFKYHGGDENGNDSNPTPSRENSFLLSTKSSGSSFCRTVSSSQLGKSNAQDFNHFLASPTRKVPRIRGNRNPPKVRKTLSSMTVQASVSTSAVSIKTKQANALSKSPLKRGASDSSAMTKKKTNSGFTAPNNPKKVIAPTKFSGSRKSKRGLALQRHTSKQKTGSRASGKSRPLGLSRTMSSSSFAPFGGIDLVTSPPKDGKDSDSSVPMLPRAGSFLGQAPSRTLSRHRSFLETNSQKENSRQASASVASGGGGATTFSNFFKSRDSTSRSGFPSKARSSSVSMPGGDSNAASFSNSRKRSATSSDDASPNDFSHFGGQNQSESNKRRKKSKK